MCSDFLADINNNHAKECRMDWGPKFGSNIKTITALGQLLLVARLELDVSTLEIPGSYESCGRPLATGERVQTCSKLYQEAFAASEQSLGKLSETSWELAHSRGSVWTFTMRYCLYSEFILINQLVSPCCTTILQRQSSCFGLCLSRRMGSGT
jgi:hypothetical protein